MLILDWKYAVGQIHCGPLNQNFGWAVVPPMSWWWCERSWRVMSALCVFSFSPVSLKGRSQNFCLGRVWPSLPSLPFIPSYFPHFPFIAIFLLSLSQSFLLPKSIQLDGLGEHASVSGVEPGPQVHFDAFTAVKMHLMATSFNRWCAMHVTVLIIRI